MSWPSYTEEEIQAVVKVLKSNKVNYWTGNECRIFEAEFAKFADSKYAVALANGTVALEAALIALRIGKDDEVIVTARTFLASVSAIIINGAKPVFIDVDRDKQNLDINKLKKAITANTKAIICVHLAGWPCDMDEIMTIADEHDLFVIEDCAQAHGGRYKGSSVGSIGHIGCWSFCQDKIMTTGGEGGMVTTNDRDLWSKIWSYKDHGKSWDAVYNTLHPPGYRWLHKDFGTNWRMTEMQAAIGRIQLKRMPEWNARRRANAGAIWDTSRNLPDIRVPDLTCASCNSSCNNHTGCVHAAYKCYIFVENGKTARDKIMADLNNQGVSCTAGSCSEVYLEDAFNNTSFRPEKRLAVARELADTSLMFSCHPTLSDSEITHICNALTNIVLHNNR